MNKKAGSPAHTVSLPKGGGALHGIGEKFAPDVQTGTGTFAIPLALPTGRNGFQPDLRLVYSTGHGNGPFGLGWTLDVPGIARQTSHGTPLYDDDRDTFVLSGAEDIAPLPREQNALQRYRPRSEGLFARIEHLRDAQHDYWEVRSKDGLLSIYGTPAAAGSDPAVVADPRYPTRIFSWKLTATIDVFGNRIEYRYTSDQEDPTEREPWRQLYLSEVRYVDYGDRDAPDFFVTIRFLYDRRPDPLCVRRAGFQIRTARRCRRIEVCTGPGDSVPTRAYHLIYLDERESDPSRLPPNRVSLLSEVRLEGYAEDDTEAMPPLAFSYTRFEPTQPRARDFFPMTGPDMPPRGLRHPDYELVDLTGDGLPDILELSGTVRYWRNLGDGRFDWPRPMADAPAGVRLGDSGVQLLDADGDGRTDLLATIDGVTGYYPLRHDAQWDRRSFQRVRTAPTFDLEDAEVRLIDLDGDGVTDVVRSGTRLECFFNDPIEGWNRTRSLVRGGLDDFPDVTFSDPRVKCADMSGDGLQDIVLVHDGLVEYWPSLGGGEWGPRVLMHRSPRLPYDYDPRRILIGDVDGDGAADFLYIDDRRVTLWINQSGEAWSDPIEIDGTPAVSDTDAIRIADMLGSGVAGVLWSHDHDSLSRDRMFFLDLTGGNKPYLLQEIDNHLGAITRVGYVSSTHHYLRDQRQAATRWKTTLPFPVQVVSRVEAIDVIAGGKLTTEYDYHHGYWDGAEREFRGFGRVDQRDSEVFTDFHASGLHPADRPFAPIAPHRFSPPTETRTWFHLGPVGDEFGEWTELDLSSEFWAGDAQTLARPPAMAVQLAGLPRRIRRDALRTLRGRTIRAELYALDQTDRALRPYVVTEQLHGVRPLPIDGDDWPGEWDVERPPIFFPHTLAERTTRWDRGDDPMTSVRFVGNYDRYGQAGSQIDIAVPRRRDYAHAVPAKRADQSDEEYLAEFPTYLATETITTHALRDDAEHFIVDRVARTRTYEIPNNGRAAATDGSAPLLDLAAAIATGAVERRLIGETQHFYDGDAFTGRPLHEIGRYGALVRTESLVMTERELAAAYPAGDPVLRDDGDAPYFSDAGDLQWPASYPAAFRDLFAANAHVDSTRPGLAVTPLGYGVAGGEADYARGYFAATERRRYDFHDAQGHESDSASARGLLLAVRHPLGRHADNADRHILRDTTIGYDDYALMPARVEDPAGLTTTYEYDHRVLQPREVRDPNGNRTAFAYTPLGLLARTAVMGKADETLGDTLVTPGTRWIYDLHAFSERGQPVSVRTSRRVHHIEAADVPLSESDSTIEHVEYSDGFGRLLQTRSQAEDVGFGDAVHGDAGLPANQSLTVPDAVGRAHAQDDPLIAPPRVVVSGWQTYDNKGRVVEKYEPFFSIGWPYAAPVDREQGQRSTMFYDPMGRLIRTVNPDGSERCVVHGVPGTIAVPDLTDPGVFEPTPWETYTYDANDNAGRTHPDAAGAYETHWNTPSSVEVGALDRPRVSTERNGADRILDSYITRLEHDIRGNPLRVFDPKSDVRAIANGGPLPAFEFVYDLANRPLRSTNIDAGVRRVVFDAAGNEIERRDSKGSVGLRSFDCLNRPSRVWARDAPGEAVTLRQHVDYGDGANAGQAPDERGANRAANRLGRVWRHFDEAGMLSVAAYDFKGNVLERSRQVVSDASILAVFDAAAPDWRVPPFRVDWQAAEGATLEERAAQLLDPRQYAVSTTYDGLDRVRVLLHPEDTDGGRSELRPRYNRAGALESVDLDGQRYVDRIAYNARGQRLLIAYGNGVMTRYSYDDRTFRLVRLRSEGFTTPQALTYRPAGSVLQDFAYEHDLEGNIVAIRDRAPDSGIDNTPLGRHALDRLFTYDALYRLVSATGRECDVAASPPWLDMPRCVDLSRVRPYTEQYRYDQVGNLEELRHQTAGNGPVRRFTIPDRNNRLERLTIGEADDAYFYDDNGNLTGENTERCFEWNHEDRLRVFRIQPPGAEPSIHAHYLYDAAGQRVKKLVRSQHGTPIEVTVFVDASFEHRYRREGNLIAHEHDIVHVMDDQRRIAMVRAGEPFTGDPSPSVTYQLGDHLGSSSVVIDALGEWTNREEHTPYGETSFGGFARKRFRFTGKERDEESGLNYHGARYYAPWLGRWVSCDPAGLVEGVNAYRYSRGNPIRFIDPSGKQVDADEDEPDVSGSRGGATQHGMVQPHVNPSGSPRFRPPPGPVVTPRSSPPRSLPSVRLTPPLNVPPELPAVGGGLTLGQLGLLAVAAALVIVPLVMITPGGTPRAPYSMPGATTRGPLLTPPFLPPRRVILPGNQPDDSVRGIDLPSSSADTEMDAPPRRPPSEALEAHSGYGRRGGPGHTGTIDIVEERARFIGGDVLTGGTGRHERAIRRPGGPGVGRFPDLTVWAPDIFDPNGTWKLYIINVGMQTRGGLPVWRERPALQELPSLSGLPSDQIIFVPYATRLHLSP